MLRLQNWLSQLLDVLQQKEVIIIRQRAQISQIGAEANGEVHQVVAEAEAVITVDRGVEGHVMEDHREDVVVDHQGLIHWHVTGVGSMAIWLATIPAPHHNHKHWVVVVQALPTEDRSNPGRQTQNVDEDVDGKSSLEASTFYAMRTGSSIPWTMQDNCTPTWNSGRLLPRKLWRKTKMK